PGAIRSPGPRRVAGRRGYRKPLAQPGYRGRDLDVPCQTGGLIGTSESIVTGTPLPAHARQPQTQDDADEEDQGAGQKPVARLLTRQLLVLLLENADLDLGVRELLAQILVLPVQRKRVGGGVLDLRELRL